MTIKNPQSPVQPPAQQLLQEDETAISYREQGKGECILFLHGLLGSSKAWAFQFEDLSDHYRIAAWDAPGYGRSDLVAVNIDAYVEALHKLIRHLDAGPVHIVGHSMGGSVAARYAVYHPENVKTLILSCSHPGYGDPETAPMSQKFENRMHELQEIGAQEYGRRRAKDLLPNEDVSPAVLVYAADIAAETNPEGLRRATRMLQLADNRPLLPEIKAPTLILTGGIDKVVQPALKEDLLRLTPFRQHIEMPGLAHAPYFQSPVYYDSLIRDFLVRDFLAGS